ncbi:YfhJ family protein [Bacillus sp. FJAT-22090]|uniref:YfhJ family protein n=1 Tax=Bacillus sp. FJAT-22090 TaxID=1581038 RepID=UPI0011AB006C|nr:YfhJ family protein [Bacillus sp. FJAT-22090]
MQTKIDELTKQLLDKNDQLSAAKARAWIELLWSDFESSYARAGYEYKGAAVTEMVIKKWIDGYGEQLHEFASSNEKYKHLLETDEFLH